MIIVETYQDEKGKAQTIAELTAKGWFLIEEQIHFDGNHLIFVKPERDIIAEIDQLKAQVAVLETKARVDI